MESNRSRNIFEAAVETLKALRKFDLSNLDFALNFYFHLFSPIQVIDVGSGKGYLSSFLSLQYGLRVYGIDSSSTNTHGAQERNRKLKKFSRAYQKHNKAVRAQRETTHSPQEELVKQKPGMNRGDDVSCGGGTGVVSQEGEEVLIGLSDVNPAVEMPSEANPETKEFFLSALSVDLVQTTSPRVPPSQLSAEERERRKRENLERKAQNRTNNVSVVFSPLTSYVTAETELRELINELEVRKPKVKKRCCSEARFSRQLLERLSQQLEFALLEHVRGVIAVPNLQRVIINKFYHRSAPLPSPPLPRLLFSPFSACFLRIPGCGHGRTAHVWRLGTQHPEDVCGQTGAGCGLQCGLLLSPAV